MLRTFTVVWALTSFTWAAPAVGSTKPEAPKPPRDRNSEAMMATGGAVLCVGVISQLVGFGTLYHNGIGFGFEPDFVPGAEIGIGLGFAVIGAAFLGVGVKQHNRWKASLAETARVQVRPMIGFGRFGVVGRF